MKYRDKTHPKREDVCFWEPKLIGHDKVRITMVYETQHSGVQTFHRQPVEIGLCQLRYLGGEFHRIMDELEDKLQEAREHMKGHR